MTEVTSPKVPKRRGPLPWLGWGCVFCAIGFAYFKWTELADDQRYAWYLNFFERNPPTVEIPAPPPGVGFSPAEVKIRLADDGAGLDEVIVRAEQGADTVELFRKPYPATTFVDEINVTIDGKKQGLTEGAFSLNVAVFDGAFWSNGSRRSLDFRVDYVRPQISVVRDQHNATVGGTELLFLRVRDDDFRQSGVRVGKVRFRGFPASEFEPEFQQAEQVYIVYFGIPHNFNEAEHEVRAFAFDQVNNEAESSFYYRAAKRKGVVRTVNADDLFLLGTVQPLVAEYLEQSGRRLQGKDGRKLLALLTGEYQKYSDARLREILLRRYEKADAGKRLWKGNFLRLPGAIARSDYGDELQFANNGGLLGSMISLGATLQGSANAAVPAANNGEVLHSGPLGTYGETVVLYHGAGLATVYGHLSSIDVRVGQNIQRGTVLGRTGRTGFSDSDNLYYEVRIDGTPVRPIEWWDERWVVDHIENKIAEVKQTLGVGLSLAEAQ